MTQHYTASLSIHKVTKTDPPTRPGVVIETKREVLDVLTITVRADTLEKLKDKIISHTELIEAD